MDWRNATFASDESRNEARRKFFWWECRRHLLHPFEEPPNWYDIEGWGEIVDERIPAWRSKLEEARRVMTTRRMAPTGDLCGGLQHDDSVATVIWPMIQDDLENLYSVQDGIQAFRDMINLSLVSSSWRSLVKESLGWAAKVYVQRTDEPSISCIYPYFERRTDEDRMREMAPSWTEIVQTTRGFREFIYLSDSDQEGFIEFLWSLYPPRYRGSLSGSDLEALDSADNSDDSD